MKLDREFISLCKDVITVYENNVTNPNTLALILKEAACYGTAKIGNSAEFVKTSNEWAPYRIISRRIYAQLSDTELNGLDDKLINDALKAHTLGKDILP